MAKISLWESQRDPIEKTFEWSKDSGYLWRWFETVYKRGLKGHSSREISFAYFLRKSDLRNFHHDFPAELSSFLRYEPFQVAIYDYYDKLGSVPKHPDTP